MKRPLSIGRVWFALGAIACVLGAGWTLRSALAQEAAVAEPAAEAAEETAAAEPVNMTIPDGDAATLDAFIRKLAESEPQGASEDEQIVHAKKVLTTILEAADRMLKAKPDDSQSIMAQRYRLMALQGLSQLGDEDAAKNFASAVEAAMANPRPEIATVGWQSFLVEKLTTWEALDDEAKAAVAAKILDRVKSPKVGSFEVSLVQLVASNLDRIDDAFVAKLLTEALPILEKSEAEDVKEALTDANLAGMLRRMTLLGEPMDLSGDLLGGGKFDWKSYRGKVVLVDFSATWCPPCIEEAPNVLNMYNLYKDKGFDVVAVSLDRTPEAAQQYVTDNGIQWATLFPAKEDDRWWNHPLARHYGITGIPTAILVDKDGKAVHMNARGELLQAELQRLLGDPAKPADDKAAKDEAAG